MKPPNRAREDRGTYMALISLPSRHWILSGALAAALCTVPGCFNPNGGVTGYFAYVSTPTSPKTVVIYDVRSGEPWFVKEVPVGKQLNFRFLSDGGDNPQYSSARLEWAMVEAGNNASKLTNQMTAPPEEACKIKVEIRQPEYHPIPDSERYRQNAVFEGVDKADSEDDVPVGNVNIYDE